MIFVVIDTNVLVSALLTQNDEAATVKVLDAMLQGRLVPLKFTHRSSYPLCSHDGQRLLRKWFNSSFELMRCVLP
jgi:hypothetical protein